MGHPVVFATDFSENSKAALDCASRLAGSSGVDLHVVHVSQALPTPDNPTPAYHTAPAILDAEVAAREAIDAIEPTVSGVRCQRVVLHGDPAHEVVEYAEQHDAGVIVIGTHGRTGLLKMLMGSVAEEIVRSAVRPVVVVKMPEPGGKASKASANPPPGAPSA